MLKAVREFLRPHPWFHDWWYYVAAMTLIVFCFFGWELALCSIANGVFWHAVTFDDSWS